MSMNKLTAKTIAAIVIGNAFEWYDFIVYSFMTVYIAKLFFPASNHLLSLLMATATFGMAFLLRPIGGILIGYYADTRGRKAALTLVMTLMTVAVALMAFTPTYAQIGSAASLLLIGGRLLQGLSAGGEFGSSSAALIELSPPNQRGLNGAWQMVGQTGASLLASSMSWLVMLLKPAQIESWGFRIPFMVGLLIAPVGVYVRRHLAVTDMDHALAQARQKTRMMKSLREHWRELIMLMGLVIGGTAAIYTSIFYFPTYTANTLHLPLQNAFTAVFIGTLFRFFLAPCFGLLSDRIGRKKILISALMMYILTVYPLFLFISDQPSFTKLILAQIATAVIMSPLDGVFVAVVTSLFPDTIRSTALSIGYNMTVMLFGGFAPFIVTWLIHVTANPLSITYYLIAANLISLTAAFCYQEEDADKIDEWQAITASS